MDHSAIRTIKDEHLAISAVLHCLLHMTRSISEKGTKPDYRAFRGMLYYLDAFPEHFHHPKEDDYLFSKLCRRTHQADEVIAGLKQDHACGVDKIGRLMQALIHLEWGGYAHLADFTAQLEDFSEFYWRHMRIEEELVLPLAERVLTEADWQEIDNVFSTNIDPLVGVDAKENFDELFARIVNLAPPPFGLGPEKTIATG
jgi:hemerythrin-like domain-containing protein